MSKLSLTRGEVITTGLAIAGRPDLTSEARMWLNLFLDEFYSNQDMDWLVKTISAQAVSNGVSLPSDYRAMKSLIMNDSGSQLEIEVINDADEYDRRRVGYSSTTGFPVLAWADWDNKTLYFLPPPKSGLTMDLKYYYYPTLPDPNDVGSDNDTIKWELPAQILVDFIKSAAMEYNDDVRQDAATQKLMDKIALARFNNRDARAGSTRTKMGRRFRKRRGYSGD